MSMTNWLRPWDDYQCDGCGATVSRKGYCQKCRRAIERECGEEIEIDPREPYGFENDWQAEWPWPVDNPADLYEVREAERQARREEYWGEW